MLGSNSAAIYSSLSEAQPGSSFPLVQTRSIIHSLLINCDFFFSHSLAEHQPNPADLPHREAFITLPEGTPLKPSLKLNAASLINKLAENCSRRQPSATTKHAL